MHHAVEEARRVAAVGEGERVQMIQLSAPVASTSLSTWRACSASCSSYRPIGSSHDVVSAASCRQFCMSKHTSAGCSPSPERLVAALTHHGSRVLKEVAKEPPRDDRLARFHPYLCAYCERAARVHDAAPDDASLPEARISTVCAEGDE